jgi:hypothetical protein
MNKPLTAAALVVALCGAASAPAASLRFFRSPSGNIGCLIGGGSVRCDIERKAWKPTAKPKSCPVDWGDGVEVTRRGRAHFTCAGDTVLSPHAKALRYGHAIRVGRFACTSHKSYMRCDNTRSDHGSSSPTGA